MKRILLFLSAYAIFSNLSCIQEEGTDFKYPRIYTNPITDITPAGALFTARIDFSNINQVTDFGFEWGANSELDNSLLLPADSIQSNFFSLTSDPVLLLTNYTLLDPL